MHQAPKGIITPTAIKATVQFLQSFLANTDSPTSNYARWQVKSSVQALIEGNTTEAIALLKKAVAYAASPACPAGIPEPQAAQDALAMLASSPTATSHSTDDLARHQIAYNALSTASWHLARGDVDQALGRILRAATHLKNACTTATVSGRV